MGTERDDLTSADWRVVVEAVEAVAGQLRRGRIDDDIAARLLALAAHPKWEVRKAAAHALLHLRHDGFDAAIARLEADDNAWVREAARQTLRRRVEPGLELSDLPGMLVRVEMPIGSGRRKTLELAQVLNRRFVAEVWHEVVKVIAPLDLALTNLERDIAGLPEGTRAHLRRARQRVRMITDILDGLRALTDAPPRDFTLEDVATLLREAEELARSATARPQTGLVVRSEIDAALRLEVSRSRVLQALTNILVNALEACTDLDRAAELHITAHRQADNVLITITDNGRGMTPEAVRDCLLPYSTSKPAGMGFGLPLARKIVEADHGGKLSIRSRPDEGTSVTVTLPLAQSRDEE